MKNIVLIGMRGSGKSKLGSKLAYQLNMDYLDIDKEVERTARMSIPEIVEQEGWEKFRELESKVARQMAFLDDHIISTGGGIILNEENMLNLKANGLVIYLKTDPEILEERIKDSDRPDLGADLAEIYEQRKELYENYSDIVFDVTEDDLRKKTQNLTTLVRTYFRR
jgi:shikimate kinase